MIGPKAPKLTRAELRAMEAQARAIVTGRDVGKCVRCHRGGIPNWDHRKNRTQGGLWLASNGQLLCGSGTTGCHGWKTTHPAEALAEGWAVPSYGDPAEWPATRYVPTSWGTLAPVLVLYDNRGQVHQITAEEALRRSDGIVTGVAA